MVRPIKRLRAEPEAIEELRRRTRVPTSAVRECERAEIILLRLDGVGVEAVAEQLATTPKRVSTWSKRFEMHGLAGLDDKPGRGRKPSIPTTKIARILTEATQPPKGKRRWSIRLMGRHSGVSASTVQRIWSRNDLKPHVTKTFKLSNDPKFEEKFWGVCQEFRVLGHKDAQEGNIKGPSFGLPGGLLRTYTGGAENRHIFEIVSRLRPKKRAASRRLLPSTVKAKT